jgi:hypothetical protein
MAAAPAGADARVVEFARREGQLHILAWTEPYAPLVDPEVLGEFVRIFAAGSAPSDDEIEGFYRQFGALRDTEWLTRMADEDRAHLSEIARLGLREPLWWLQELGAELRLSGDLYRGLAESDLGLLREVLRTAPPEPTSLVDIRLLSGRLVKLVATPEERKRRVGSFGEWKESPGDPGRPLSDEECLRWARELLRRQLNRYEARANRQWMHPLEIPWDALRAGDPVIRKDENAILGGFRSFTFDSLITALYLQLSDCAEQGGLLRRCRGCDRLFFPTRPNQFYCQTKCSDAYRRHKFLARRAGKQEEETRAHGR